MNTITQTVGEIAAATPAAASVFEKYHIDYCCGGKRALTDACQERGLAPETVLAEVEQASVRPEARQDWSHATLSALISHIVSTHHAYLRTELPLLEARMKRVAEKHGPRIAGLPEVFAGLATELMMHLRKEEMILFPAIEEIESARAAGRRPQPSPFGTVQNPIRMMVAEHDDAGNALAEIRRVTNGYAPWPDACNTTRALFHGLAQLEADLHQHIHLENNILFPRAVELESQQR